MYTFSYRRPQSIEEAVVLLSENAGAQALAGGQTLIPTLKHRLAQPETLVDLSALREMQGIHLQEQRLKIGALTCHSDVCASAVVRNSLPSLAHLASGIGDPMVRNMGTIGGSLAYSHPAADYPGAVLGLGASIHTDRRTIAADDYFLGLLETALEPNELIISVDFPIPLRSAYIKFPNPASGYVVVGVFLAEFDFGIRVAINGAADCVFREPGMETALAGNFSADALDNISIPMQGLNDDIHASAAYRAHLAVVLAKRAVRQILKSSDS